MVSRYSPDAKDSGGSSQEDEETVVSDLQHALSGRVPEPELDTVLTYLGYFKAGLRIRIQSGQWIRIRIRSPDPDLGGQK